jgi:hypothetical protein
VFGGLEIGADQALGRARLLDLRDQRVASGRFARKAASNPRGALCPAARGQVGQRGGGLRAATSLRLVSQISVSLSVIAAL